MQDSQLTSSPTTKPIRLDKKKMLFMDYWTNPANKTFGNVYQSGLAAGFSPSYSRNLTHLSPKWLSAYIDKLDLHPEHIKQGVQKIATSLPNSKSPDDTKLKAYELLARFNGMLDNKQTTNITLVQPILSGASSPKKVYNTHIDTHVVPEKTAQK